jgi:lipooligosaccharide transport system permease protein
MMAALASLPRILPFGLGSRRAALLIERNVYVYRRGWLVLLSGFFEPLFYLIAIGLGIGGIVGDITGPDGALIPYPLFVAPALLATASMNGAIAESTFNVFFKLNYQKTYDAVLATPLGAGDVALGEIGWSMIRSTLYAIGFVIVITLMGLVESPWVVLAVPAATLPLFLFSGTFYPITAYPEPIRVIVALTPLYQGVDLIRSLVLGTVHVGILFNIAYLSVMGLLGLSVVARRLDRLLLK